MSVAFIFVLCKCCNESCDGETAQTGFRGVGVLYFPLPFMGKLDKTEPEMYYVCVSSAVFVNPFILYSDIYHQSLTCVLGNSYWMAATDAQDEGTWIWQNSKLTLRYQNWAPGDPKNAGNNEDCSIIRRPSLLRWVDIPCINTVNWPIYPLCEIRWVSALFICLIDWMMSELICLLSYRIIEFISLTKEMPLKLWAPEEFHLPLHLVCVYPKHW